MGRAPRAKGQGGWVGYQGLWPLPIPALVASGGGSSKSQDEPGLFLGLESSRLSWFVWWPPILEDPRAPPKTSYKESPEHCYSSSPPLTLTPSLGLGQLPPLQGLGTPTWQLRASLC